MSSHLPGTRSLGDSELEMTDISYYGEGEEEESDKTEADWDSDKADAGWDSDKAETDNDRWHHYKVEEEMDVDKLEEGMQRMIMEG